jgi:hypothetical protein
VRYIELWAWSVAFVLLCKFIWDAPWRKSSNPPTYLGVEECPDCEGAGCTEGERCPVCRGTGWVKMWSDGTTLFARKPRHLHQSERVG